MAHRRIQLREGVHLLLLELIHILDGWQAKGGPSLVLPPLCLEVCICQPPTPPLDQEAAKNDDPEHAVGEDGDEGRLTLQVGQK